MNGSGAGAAICRKSLAGYVFGGPGVAGGSYRTACIGMWHLDVNADGSYNGLVPAATTHHDFDETASPSTCSR